MLQFKRRLQGEFDGKTIFVDKYGYPSVILNGKTKRIHRIVAEKALGRGLPKGSVVHHIDENRMNYSRDNLLVMQSVGEHLRLHARLNARKEGYNYLTHRRCTDCKLVKPLSEFHKDTRDKTSGVSRGCKECNKARSRLYLQTLKQLA